MADSEDYSKLKVTELRKLLKEQGLPTTGNKPTLVARLQGVATTDDNNDDDKNIEEEEDSVLDESLGEKDSSLNLDDTNKSETTLQESDVIEEDKAKPTVVKIGGLTETERLAQRAKKFGAVSADAKKKLRAERFSTGVESSGENKDDVDKLKQRADRFKTVTSPTLSKVETEDKLKKRAERFGVISSSETNKTATETIKPKTTAENQEKLNKRAERFGVVSTTDTTDSNKPKVAKDSAVEKRKARFGVITGPTSNGDVEAKKQKRAERFGITA